MVSSPFSLDELLSYQTPKIVRIKDRRLGLIHYGFILGVIGYIIGFQLLAQKHYLEIDIPQGTIRASLKRSPHTSSSNITQFPYCTYPGNNNSQALECLFWDESEVVFPVTEQAAMLAATRVNTADYHLNCDQTRPNCTFTASNQNSYYIGDIERFTLMVDHSMFTPRLGIQRNSRGITGRLLDSNGNEIQSTLSPPNQFGQSGKFDILELKVVLAAANVDLDSESPLISSSVTKGEIIRHSGTVLLYFIEYDNTFSFSTNNIRYTVKVQQLKDAEFKSVEELFFNKTFRTERNRHGARILFLPIGQIGEFQFQALILTLVSGAALMAVATVVTDIIATTFLPEKKTYEEAKYQVADAHVIPQFHRDNPATEPLVRD